MKKKISKKIVALLTMAAFVLTLLPTAAFATAPVIGTNIKLDASYLAVVNGKGEAQAAATVETGDVVQAKWFLNKSEGSAVTETLFADKGRSVVFWVTENANDGFDKAVSALNTTATINVENVAGSNAKKMAVPTYYGTDVSFTFDRAGTYYLHAGVLKDYTSAPPVDADYTADNITELKLYSTITVESAAQVVNKVELEAADAVFPGDQDNDTLYGNSDSTTVTLDKVDLLPNSIIEYTLEGTAYKGWKAAVLNDEGGVAEAEVPGTTVAGETFNVVSNSENLIVSNSTVTTAPDGTFNLSFKVAKAGNYRITLHNSDVNYVIYVNYKTSVDDIETILSDGETLLAGTDSKNYVGNNIPSTFASAVQFEITNNEGGIVTGSEALDNEPAARVQNTGTEKHSDYLEIVSKPDASKLTAADLILVPSGSAYTLQYVGNDAARDLIPGEYVVKVSLLSGEYAVATLTFANYGTTQNVVLVMTAVPTNGTGEAVQTEVITNQVKLGRDVTVRAMYVDENGVKINVQDAVYGFEGRAVDNSINYAQMFRTKANVAYNEGLLGSTITVTAVDTNQKQLATQELTVVDSYTDNSLAFDKTRGLVDVDNNVTVSVVDEAGNVVPVTGTVTAYVEDQSNADADVTVKVAKNMTNGRDGKLILNSDEATTADIVVAVKAGNAIYAGTLHYTFGEVTGVGTSVVMTIGSVETLVNGEIVTIEAAPYVDNNRTYVPLRALAQDFGADVDWDAETGDITVVANGKTIVLNVGETDYTVNGETESMDVAPVLNSDVNRVLVPVRFVAEELGYTVTALYAADGTTASVYFTM